MLVIKRKGHEAITIEPQDDLDRSRSIDELFANGPIEIRVFGMSNKAVRVAIEAPPELKIWRGKRPVQSTNAGKDVA